MNVRGHIYILFEREETIYIYKLLMRTRQKGRKEKKKQLALQLQHAATSRQRFRECNPFSPSKKTNLAS